MQNNMNGFMDGYMNGNGIWPVVGALLAILLVVAIVKMVQKK